MKNNGIGGNTLFIYIEAERECNALVTNDHFVILKKYKINGFLNLLNISM